MKTLLHFFFIFGISISSLQAQKVEVISLMTTNYQKLETDFYIAEVEDHRADKKYIGTIKKGLSNKKRPAILGYSFVDEIKRFLRIKITRRSEKRPLKMLVHRLWITEKTSASSERGFLELSVEFQEKIDSVYISLATYDISRKIKGVDVTKKHGKSIGVALITCLKNLIDGKPSTISTINAERIDFTYGIPDSLSIGFYSSFKALVYNQSKQRAPVAKAHRVNDLIVRYDLRDQQDKVISEYAYYTGQMLLLNAYLIGISAKYYLIPATNGRYLVYVDKYSKGGGASLAFGIVGAVASTKTRASVLDTKNGTFLECEAGVMDQLLSDHEDLLAIYNASNKKPKDQIAIIQKLNDRLMETDSE